MSQSESTISFTNSMNVSFRMKGEEPIIRSRRWYDKIFEWILPGRYEKEKLDCIMKLAQKIETYSTDTSKRVFSAIAEMQEERHITHFFSNLSPVDKKIENIKERVLEKKSSSIELHSDKKEVGEEQILLKGQFYQNNATLFKMLYSIDDKIGPQKNPYFLDSLSREIEQLEKMDNREKEWAQKGVDYALSKLHGSIVKEVNRSFFSEISTKTSKKAKYLTVCTNLARFASIEKKKGWQEFLTEIDNGKTLSESITQFKRKNIVGSVQIDEITDIIGSLQNCSSNEIRRLFIGEIAELVSSSLEKNIGNTLSLVDDLKLIADPIMLQLVPFMENIKRSLSTEEYETIKSRSAHIRRLEKVIQDGATQESRFKRKELEHTFTVEPLDNEKLHIVNATFLRAQDRIFVGDMKLTLGEFVPLDKLIDSLGTQLYGSTGDRQKMENLKFLLFSLSNEQVPYSIYSAIAGLLPSTMDEAVTPLSFKNIEMGDPDYEEKRAKYVFSFENNILKVRCTNCQKSLYPDQEELYFAVSATVENGIVSMNTIMDGKISPSINSVAIHRES